MKKILILTDDFPPHSRGGAANVAYNHALGLQKAGHEVVIATTVRNILDEGIRYDSGIKIYSLAIKYNERWRAYLSLYNTKSNGFVKYVLKEVQPDIVHAHNIHYYLSYNSLRLSKHFGAKVVLSVHDCMLFTYGKFTDFIDSNNYKKIDSFEYKIRPTKQLLDYKWRYNPFRNLAIKFFLNFVDHICAVSYELKKALEANGIKKVIVVHNAIDEKKWTVDSDRVSDFINTNKIEQYYKIVFSGKLTRAKGGDQLIKAIKIVEKKDQVCLIVIAQDDAYTKEFKADAIKHGIKAVFTGWIDEKELPIYYYASDLVVFPSVCFDTFGLVNLEGMICHKPLISSCFGGAKEVVTDNVSGFIINPYDTKVFANKIEILMNDAEISKTFGDAGYNKAIVSFNLDKQIKEFIKVYKSK